MARFEILSLTDAAVERVKELMSNNEGATGIIIGVKKGGCAGMEYTIQMSYKQPENADLIEQDGARVYLSRDAVLFLLGTKMDFEVTTLRTGFTFQNPNQTSACGCGESVELTPVSQEKLNFARS